jgi:cell division protein FtsQ
MSDYATRAAGADARAGARSRPAAKKGGEGAIVLVLAALAALALLGGALVLVPPAMRISRYEVVGNSGLSRDEVLGAALIHEKEYFFSLDASRVKAAVEAEPRVESARVTKLFPNGLRIALVERRPVATVLVESGGRPAAASVDRAGIVYAVAGAEEAASVPVLSGIRFEGFRPGARLPESLVGLAASLGQIQASEGALLKAVSEIRVVAPSGGRAATAAAPELLVYPIGSRIPVRARVDLDARTLRSIILVLDVLGTRLGTRSLADPAGEIDFRSGTVVLRGKEGHPE